MPYKRKRSYSAPGSSKKYRSTPRRYSYRKKKYSKKRFRGLGNARMSKTIPKSINLRQVGLPRKLVTQFTYRDYLTFNETNEQRIYGLNCMFKPKLGGNNSSHQPRWFDQLLLPTLYQRYAVYRADVELVFRNANNDDAMMCIYVGTAGNFVGDIDSLFQQGENPYTYTRIVNGNNTGGPDHKVVFRGSYSMSKVLGCKKGAIYTDDRFHALWNYNPVQPVNLVLLGTQDAPGGIAEQGEVEPDPPAETAAPNVKCEVYIKYYAVLDMLSDRLPGSANQT